MSSFKETTTLTDLSFLPEDRREKLDAYLPDPVSWPDPRPVVILIHGGGWAKGDKAEPRQREIAAALGGQGYAVFSINYRLNTFSGDILKSPVTSSCWPDCLHDCRAAIARVRQGASEWNLDPARIALFGLSAGAHLALLTAATTGHPELDRLGGSQPVSCLIYFYGVHNLDPLAERWRFGETHPDPGQVRKLASPSSYLSSVTPPVLVVHGQADTTIPEQDSLDLVARLLALGIAHRSRILPGAPHGFGLVSAFADLRTDVFSFLDDHLGAARTRAAG